jgi:hypothetical protein
VAERAPVILSYLREAMRYAIHQASREVIGGNLSRRALVRDGLERLQASVTRQANDAQELQRKLAAVRASEALQEELADLLEFFGTFRARSRASLAPSRRRRNRTLFLRFLRTSRLHNLQREIIDSSDLSLMSGRSLGVIDASRVGQFHQQIATIEPTCLPASATLWVPIGQT